jgi:hypothetical protein
MISKNRTAGKQATVAEKGFLHSRLLKYSKMDSRFRGNDGLEKMGMRKISISA